MTEAATEKPAQLPTDIVHMRHDDSPGQIGEATRLGFETVWKGKGWELVDEAEAAQAEADAALELLGAPAPDYESMTVAELEEAADRRSLDRSDAKRKPELVRLLTDADAAEHA